MKARDIMTEYAQVVIPTDSITHAAALMRDSNIGFLPVVEDRESNHLVEVITDRDITIRHVAAADENDCLVNLHMTGRDLVTVSPDGCRGRTQTHEPAIRCGGFPSSNAEGRILGVIAQADVAVKEEKPKDISHVLAEISAPAKPDR